MWSTVREKVRALRRPTDVMLDGAIVLAVEGNTLVLGHPAAPLAKRLNESRNVEIIREALKDALGVDWNVRCDVGTPAVPVTAGPPTDRAVPPPPAPPDGVTRRKSPSNCCRTSWARARSRVRRPTTGAAAGRRRCRGRRV